jgi:hypothetical protein
MNPPQTRVEILNSSLQLITWVKSPYLLNATDWLQYSKELSDFGQCKFRISSYDTLFKEFGDILQPHQNHIRVLRGNVIVWTGAIVENTKRTKDFVEVIACEYEWYLNKILVNRSSLDPGVIASSSNNNGYDGIYRIFNTANGATTMQAAVTAIMNETITNYQGANGVHPLANLTIGTIQNPNYPPNITNGASPPAALTGAWYFGDGTTAPAMTFDFHTILYILKSFSTVTYSDFQIINNNGTLVFNFLNFLGNDNHETVNFTWGQHGNAVDFNVPRLGQQMANELIGIATDINGSVLNFQGTDQTSVTNNGIIQSVAAYADIKDQATLNARIQAEIPLISEPNDSPLTFTMDENGFPLGLYDIGDIVTCNVNHDFLTYSAIKRVVGITVAVGTTGRELTTVQLNTPLPGQVAN